MAPAMSESRKRGAEEELPAKKVKRKKAKFQDDENFNTKLGINTTFARTDQLLLADLIARKLARFGTDLSPVELSDITIPTQAIQDTTGWLGDRTADGLPQFVEKVSPDPEGLRRSPKKKGALHTLIVTAAGQRAADVVRVMRVFQTKDNNIAKLFAKHMKVEEQVSFLKSKKSGIGVGTPARLTELVDNGALNIEALRLIVIDASHIDQKQRGILDMKDTMMPLARFLTKKDLKSRYVDADKPAHLVFY